MKYLSKFLIMILSFIFITSTVYANVGDFGFSGGISEGRTLPKTTEQLLKSSKSSTKLQTSYKEMIFLNGQAKEFVGTLVTNVKGNVTGNSGTYTVSYVISNSAETDNKISLSRNISYKVNYRREGTQIIKDYEVSKWSEKIVINDKTYNLDPNSSKSTISIIEDETPGVDYYKGDISQRAVYTVNNEKVINEISGSIYGYSSAWSSTETQRLNGTIISDNWQMEYQVRPSVSVGKVLQYSENEPTAISFDGNYKEVMQNKSGLSYTILANSKTQLNNSTSGNTSIPVYNTFEQLVAPSLANLKGHFAESDIKKLFSMQVLSGDTSYYNPSQSITRGEYIQMLARAIKLPIEEISDKKTSSYGVIFSDVLPNRPDYPYIMAAYEAGITSGRSNGLFGVDEPIAREEAIVMLIRTLGLQNIGITNVPLTSFVDDSKISSWAKAEVNSASILGIISGDSDGKFNPKSYLNKAEAAAIVNRLINYMRTDLQVDYTENIVNYLG